jgi:hypothetical protein
MENAVRDISVIVKRIQADLPVTDEELSAAKVWLENRNNGYPPLTLKRFLVLVLIGVVLGVLILKYQY